MRLNKLITLLSFSASILAIGAFKGPTTVATNAAEDTASTINQTFNPDAPDVSATGLRVVLNQSATTETSQSFKISFNSDVAGAYINPALGEARNYPEVVGVFLAVDDDSYPRTTKMVDLPYYDVPTFPTSGSEVEQTAWRDKYQKKDGDGNYVYNSDGTPALQDNHFYESDRPIYNAYVHRIEPVAGQEEIVIPRYIKYGSRWTFRVNYIGEDVFNAAEAKTPEAKKGIYKDLKRLIVGDNIKTVSEKAVINTTDDLAIKFVSAQSAISFPEGAWTDCKSVSYNYSPTSHELAIFDGSLKAETEDPDNPIREKAYVFSSSSPRSFASPYTFVVGYINEDASKSRPLILEYTFVGENTKRYAEFELSNNVKYGADVVGQNAGSYTLDKNVEFRIDAEHMGKKINQDSLIIRNIYEMKERANPETDPIEPNLDKEYSSTVKLGDVQEVALPDVMDVKFNGVGEVFGYGRIDMTFTPHLESYKKFKQSMYESYEKKIASGEYEIRFLIRACRSSYYIFTMKDNSVIKVGLGACTTTGIPTDFVKLNAHNPNSFQYMFVCSMVNPGFKLSDVKRVEIQGLSVSMDISATKTGTSQIVSKSDILFRFGYTDLMPSAESHSIFNGNSFLAIMIASFVGVYVLLAAAYYLYSKKAYKNDEFRRVDTKKYVKKASIGLLGSGIFFTAITFIIMRFSLFCNSIAMHNILDPFVIGFGVVGLICLGYFIKYLVVVIKQEKERRKRLKLKLDADAEEDGTN